MTAEARRCSQEAQHPIVIDGVDQSSFGGYLSSNVTTETGLGGAQCPWRLKVAQGQRINITLINFARVSLRTGGAASDGSVAQNPAVPLAVPAAGPTSSPSDDVRPTPKICYQLANLRERRYNRVLTECEGGPRTSHAFLSSSNEVEVEIIVAQVLSVHFLLHFQGRQSTLYL